MPDEQTPTEAASAGAASLYKCSDAVLAGILGDNLLTGTVRLVLIAVAGAVIVAIIAALIG